MFISTNETKLIKKSEANGEGKKKKRKRGRRKREENIPMTEWPMT